MNTSTNSVFLKEMGITEWTSRDAKSEPSQALAVDEGISQPAVNAATPTPVVAETIAKAAGGIWWFFGNKPQGDAELLFQNVIRVLGLSPQAWFWKNPTEILNLEQLPQDGSPIVALAFGGLTAQKLSGERDGLSELRETVLAINAEGAEDLPLIATFELNQLIANPKNKALFWQDLLLAKSVLQNI